MDTAICTGIKEAASVSICGLPCPQCNLNPFCGCSLSCLEDCQCGYPLSHAFHHYGDNEYVRVFVKANVDDVSSWELIGIRNSNWKWYPPSLFDCIQFDTGNGGCHANIYHSWGKHHPYINLGDDGRILDGTPCQNNPNANAAEIEACGELIEPSEIRMIPADIGTWPYATHNVGSDFFDGDNTGHFIENLQSMHSRWSDEGAWDDRYFCGGKYYQFGLRLDYENN